MINITVTVAGPGQCIGNEMLIIEKALRDAGYTVEVIDSYPLDTKEIKSATRSCNIVLKAEHRPWGGSHEKDY